MVSCHARMISARILSIGPHPGRNVCSNGIYEMMYCYGRTILYADLAEQEGLPIEVGMTLLFPRIAPVWRPVSGVSCCGFICPCNRTCAAPDWFIIRASLAVSSSAETLKHYQRERQTKAAILPFLSFAQARYALKTLFCAELGGHFKNRGFSPWLLSSSVSGPFPRKLRGRKIEVLIPAEHGLIQLTRSQGSGLTVPS